MLKEWVAQARPHYHNIDFDSKLYPQRYLSEKGPMDWPEERFKHIISLRQEALEEARKRGADFYFVSKLYIIILLPNTFAVI